jgi:signal transduction histidine kinase
VGGRVVRPDEVGLLARLAADHQPATADVDLRGLRVTTVPVNGRAAGLLYARSLEPMVPLRDDEVAVLDSIVSGIGEVAQRAVVDAGLREARQRIEVDEVRAKLARDLDERLGAVLRDAAAAVDEELERAPDDETSGRLRQLRHLLSRGLMEMHATSTSAAALAVREGGLLVAVRGLLTNFERRTGVLATLRSEGEPATVPRPVGECIHGVISDALDLVVEPGRGSMVSVTIRHGDGIVVTVRDDGTGLSRRTAESPGPGVLFAVGALRDRLRAIGGRLDLAGATPRGVELVARVPLAAQVRAPFSAEART